MLDLAYGGKEKTNTGWKFLNNNINKKEKQGDKVKNQLYKIVAYNIKWKSESLCVYEARVHWRSRMWELRNSLGEYGDIRVVRISDDLGGSSSRGWGCVVAKSAAVHSRWCIKNSVWVQMGSYGRSVYFSSPSVGQSDVFEDFRCLNSYPLDQVGSGNFLGGRFMIGWKRVFF